MPNIVLFVSIMLFYLLHSLSGNTNDFLSNLLSKSVLGLRTVFSDKLKHSMPVLLSFMNLSGFYFPLDIDKLI